MKLNKKYVRILASMTARSFARSTDNLMFSAEESVVSAWLEGEGSLGPAVALVLMQDI